MTLSTKTAENMETVLNVVDLRKKTALILPYPILSKTSQVKLSPRMVITRYMLQSVKRQMLRSHLTTLRKILWTLIKWVSSLIGREA